MNKPVIKIELESMRHRVSTMLQDRNNELNQVVLGAIDKQINEKWVMEEINFQVEQCIREAIKGISNNYALKTAVTNTISDFIAQKLSQTD